MSSPARAVVDTVVLRYFLFVDRMDLLFSLLGEPIAVPDAVYDLGQEQIEHEHLMSEIERSIRWHRRVAADRRRPEDKHNQASGLEQRLVEVRAHMHDGRIVVEQLTAGEFAVFARLTSIEHVAEFGIVAPLGAGEAACIAMAHERSMILVTDDNDALRAFDAIKPGAAYERIRKLLIRAVAEGLVDKGEANATFSEMVALGFYGGDVPFPGS